MAIKFYKDIKRCPLCGGDIQKWGTVYLEFRCKNNKCQCRMHFPSNLNLSYDEQIDRFNNRFYDFDGADLSEFNLF